MHKIRLTILFPAAVFLASAVAFGAEKTVTAEIAEVDAASKSITIGEQTLDVTRKTKITVDGKKATLTDIKKGQKAKVVYDQDLEVATSIMIGDEPEDDGNATANDLKALQGEWKCIADRNLEKKAVKDEDRRVTIKGHSLIMKRTYGDKRGTYAGKFEIDASNGHFDFVGKSPNGELSEWIGIYKIDNDTLSFSYRLKKDDNTVRPKELKEEGSILQVFQRDND